MKLLSLAIQSSSSILLLLKQSSPAKMEEMIRQLDVVKSLDVDMRFVGDLPIVAELRSLGISTNLIAKELQISPSTAVQYTTGKKDMPAKYIPQLMGVLNTAIKSWRVIIKEFRDGKHGPLTALVNLRLRHYEELVDFAEDQYLHYTQVLQQGPDR